MTDILFVGDSHLGSIRRAWDGRPEPLQDVSAKFFALPAKHLSEAQCWKPNTFGVGHLAQTHEAIATLSHKINDTLDIALDDISAVIHVGPVVPVAKIFPVLSKYSVDGIQEVAGAAAMSNNAFRSFCRSIAESNPLLPPWTGPDVPRLVVTRPRQSEDAIELMPNFVKDEALRERFKTSSILAAVYAIFDDAYEVLSSKDNYTLVRQSEETFGVSGLTRSEFSVGSKGLLGDDHEETDFFHMNVDYGKLVLDRLAESLQQPLIGR